MSSISCKVIMDILPLYVDKVCCEDTCEMVEKHVNECMECKKILLNMTTSIKTENKDVDISEKEAFKHIKKKFNIRALIICVTTIVILILIFPIINWAFGRTPSYSSMITDYHLKQAFSLIIDSNYKKAALHFSYYEGEPETDRVKNEDEMVSNLEFLKDNGISIISLDNIHSFYEDRLLISYVTITIMGKSEYKFTVEFITNNTKPQMTSRISNVKEYTTESGWVNIDNSSDINDIQIFINALKTYYPG